MEENKDGAEKKWRMVFEEMVETEDLQFLTGNRQTNWQFLILQLVRAVMNEDWISAEPWLANATGEKRCVPCR